MDQADSFSPLDPRQGPEPRPGPTPPGPTPDPEPTTTPQPQPKPTPIPSPRRPVDRIAEALAPRPAPVDRIADALAPRDKLLPTPTDPPSLATTDPSLDRALETGTPNPQVDPERAQWLERVRQAEHDARERKSYRDYMEHARATHEDNRRAEYADYLERIADGQRAKVLDLGMQADTALASGSVLHSEHLRAEARRTSEDATDLETKARQVRAGEFAPDRVEVEPADWARINDDVGTMAIGGVGTGDRSALTGDNDPAPVDRSRPYGKRGGLRAPLAVHQLDLENAMPREADGQVVRLADPRSGNWFGLANDGGPAADPTRGINCVDGVLSLYETYVHGRPRVSAPRTFDSYAQGDPTRPLGAEEHGLARIEDTVQGEFQGLCPYVGGLSALQAKQAVDTAMTNLHNHLYNVGHGAFAFIVTDSEEGTAHAWAAVNQNGTILFLDPQTGRLSEEAPLYTHTGDKNDGNVISMDAVVVNGLGELTPLPYHKPGLWSRSSLQPTGASPEVGGGGTEAGDGREQVQPPSNHEAGRSEPDSSTDRNDAPVLQPDPTLASGTEATEGGATVDDPRGGPADGPVQRTSPSVTPAGRSHNESSQVPLVGVEGGSAGLTESQRAEKALLDSLTGDERAALVKSRNDALKVAGALVRPVPGSDESDRLRNPIAGATEGRDVERAPESVDIRPTAGRDIPEGPQLSGQDPADRPSGSGTDRHGASAVGPSDGTDSPGDARGRREDGLGVRAAARVGDEPTGPARPAEPTPAAGSANEGAADSDDDFDVDAAERAMLESLEPDDRTAIEESLTAAEDAAARVSPLLHHAVAALNSLGRDVPLKVVKEQYRVKTADSLGRTFAVESEFEDLDVQLFLSQTKDRVRFSVQVPEDGYVEAVQSTLDELANLGLRTDRIVNFWNDNGRHNGLNVTLTDSEGFLVELQFPTALSLSVSSATHDLYKKVRFQRAPSHVRVAAFLTMLAINKEMGIASRRPTQLDRLPINKTVDTTFKRFVEDDALTWADYSRYLARQNQSFGEVLAGYSLTLDDVFGDGRSDEGDDRPAVRLSSGPEVRHVGDDIQPDRLPGDTGQPLPSGDLERPAEGLDLRPRPGSGNAVRRQVPGPQETGGPDNSRADSSGSAAHGAPERGSPSGDGGGRRADGLELRPTTPAEHAAGLGEIVATNAGEAVINAQVGQTLGALGDAFEVGAHYLDLFEYEHERRQAERLGDLFDVRALEAAHGRTDELGNPDVIVRAGATDAGAYGDLKRLDPDLQPNRKDADYSRRVEKRLREPFGQDPRITVAVVDGRDVGLTIDAAVRGIRRALGFWRQQGREVTPEQRMIVFTGDGGSVVWRGDTGDINVSA